MSLIDLTQHVKFQKSISVGDNQNIAVLGSIRFNETTGEFEGYTNAASAYTIDSETTRWRPFTSNIATSTTEGLIRVGENLNINTTTGVLSSVTTGNSRIYQRVITVSNEENRADYSSITTAINNAIGTYPDYDDGSITGGSISLGAPSATNRYIILVSPGQYSESVYVPSYVSLVGEGKDTTTIKLTTGGSSSITNNSIRLAGNTKIQNLGIELDADGENNITGVYSGNSYINIDNIKITDSGTSSTNNTIGLYLEDGSDIRINDVDTIFDLGSSSCIGGYLNNIGADLFISSSNISITSGTTNNYGLYIDSTSDSIIENSKLYISSANNNYGVYHKNGDSEIRYTDINCDGDTNNDTDSGYGVACTSDNAKITSTATVIQFINNNATVGKDVIYSTNTSTLNFVSSGYTAGKVILISGASNSANNNYFTISKVTTDSLTLAENDTLVSEVAGSSITIKQLHTIKTKHSTFKATSNGSAISNAIAVLSSSSDYHIKVGNTLLEGGVANSGTGSKLEIDSPQIVKVGLRDCEFKLLSEALSSIIDADSTKRYVIQIEPGEYTETSSITCKQYVNIIGSGYHNTIINFDLTASSIGTSASCLVMASNMELTGINIKNTTTAASNNEYGICIYGSGKSSLNIHKCKLDISGTALTMYGIYIDNCIYKSFYNTINATTSGDGYDCFGIYNEDSIVYDESSTITVVGGDPSDASSTINTGITNIRTNIHIINPKITVSGNRLNNDGISCSTGVGTTDVLAQVFNGDIVTSDTGNRSINVTGNYYSLIMVNCRMNGTATYPAANDGIRFLGCYQITGTTPLTFTELNRYGQSELSSMNLTIGNGTSSSISGTDNLLVGVDCGQDLTSGSRNTFIGIESGQSTTDGEDNTYIGNDSGKAATSADFNTYIGSNSGSFTTTGSQNVLVGRNTGFSMTSGLYNTFVGESSGYKLTTGDQNVFLGQGTGFNTTTGAQNVFIGGGDTANIGAGFTNTTGTYNTFVGFLSGKTNATGTNNTFIGNSSGFLNTGDNNTFIGGESGYTNDSGTDNVFIGNAAGYTNSTGTDTTVMGNMAGYKMTSGYNVAIGSQTGYNTSSGVRNVFIGGVTSGNGTDSAGYSNTTGNDNIMIGSKAGKTATASDNVLVGSNVGSSLTTGTRNVMIGGESGINDVLGSYNLLVGYGAGTGLVGSGSTSGNIMMGYQAGNQSRSDKSVYIGKGAGYYQQGDRNVFVGFEAGNADLGAASSGVDNVVIGTYAGHSLKGGNRNLLLGGGSDANDTTGAELRDGDDNILMGYKSGKSILDADKNIILGSEAGYDVNTGNSNILMGYRAGYEETAGSNNILIGTEAGFTQKSSVGNIINDNICVGYQSGRQNASGENNINIGTQAGYTATTTDKNLNIGYQSGYLETGSGQNINIGYKAGRKTTTSTNGIVIGYEACSSTSGSAHTGDSNLIIGNQSGYSLESGAYNVFMGNKSGYTTTTGAKNIFMGNLTGYLNTTGAKNIFIGSASNSTTEGVGYNNTEGNQNLFIGYDAGKSNTTGDNNVFLGSEAGSGNTTADENINLGLQAGKALVSGSYNINIGTKTGLLVTTGTRNVFIGYQAGYDTDGTGITDNIVIGSNAGKNINTNNSIFIGYETGLSNTTGENNIFMGYQSGKNVTVGGNNLFIGNVAGYTTTSGGNNVFFGNNAGYLNSSGDNNVFIGNTAGYSNTIGDNNVFLGRYTGFSNTTGYNNVFVGNSAGFASTTSENNIFIGNSAGHLNTTGDNNIFIGRTAGCANTTGENNLYVGNVAGYSSTTGINNVFFGNSSGYFTTTGKSNIFMGNVSGYTNTTGENNIFIGNNAGYYNTTANNNIFIGETAGKNVTTGENNTFIGYESGKTNTSGDNNIMFGYKTGSDTSGSISNNIFIGVENGINAEANDLILIGYNAGKENTSASETIAIGKNALVSNQTGIGNTCIGLLSGGNIRGGTLNNCLGSYSGQNITSGNFNICIGDFAGGKIETGNNNIAIGANTINTSNSSASNNIAIGVNSFFRTTTGGNNIGIGYQAGYYYTINQFNTFLGYQAGYGSSGFNYGTNTGNGEWGGTYGDGNTAIGYQAGLRLTSGGRNNFIGYQAGESCTTGHNNTCVGFDSGPAITTGKENLLLMTGSGIELIDGSRNVSLGYDTFYRHQSSWQNIYIGYFAGKGNESDDLSSSAINNDGSYNIGIGSNVATSMSSGNYNICIGDNAAYGIENGDYNIVIGEEAGYNMYDTNNSVVIGNRAGYNANDVSNSVLIGYRAGYSATLRNDTNNILIGSQAGYNVDGDNNILITPSGGTGSLTTSNKFCIYKDNEHQETFNESTGKGKPLIYGDIVNKKLAINTNSTSNISIPSSNTNAILLVNGGVLANHFTPFTGVHFINPLNPSVLKEGLILSSTGNTDKKGIIDVIVDVDLSLVQNDKNVYGVYSGKETESYEDTTNKYIDNYVRYGKYYNYFTENNSKGDEKQTSNIMIEILESDSDESKYFDIYEVNEKYINPYFVSNTITNTTYKLAALGEGQVWVTNINGEIENGDYITTSNIAGYGMRQNDDLLHNYTLGKCIENINWNNVSEIIEHNGSSYKKYLIACTYHCG